MIAGTARVVFSILGYAVSIPRNAYNTCMNNRDVSCDLSSSKMGSFSCIENQTKFYEQPLNTNFSVQSKFSLNEDSLNPFLSPTSVPISDLFVPGQKRTANMDCAYLDLIDHDHRSKRYLQSTSRRSFITQSLVPFASRLVRKLSWAFRRSELILLIMILR